MALFFCVDASGYPASTPNYSLEIIQPRPGLTTANRFYKAYPGLEYNVRLAVIGGLYPYTFSLTAAPSGMSIDSRGEISWSNPTTSGSPHTVTARVVDSQATAVTVTWTITVTTSGFIFMDASAANGGDGTTGSPFNEIADWYGTYASTTHDTAFLYLKNGTYPSYITANNQFEVPSHKPRVWLAYPGHSPKINFGAAHMYVIGADSYFDGLEFDSNGSPATLPRGIVFAGSTERIVFRRSQFHNLISGGTGSNSALIFSTACSNSGSHWAFQDNEGYGVVGDAYWLLGYCGYKVSVEDNYLHDIDGDAIGPKESNQQWIIRKNRFTGIGDEAVGAQMYYVSGRPVSGDLDISYNQVMSGRVRINSNQSTPTLPAYVYRNSICAEVHAYKVTESTGPYYFYDNVIINDLTETDKIRKLSIDAPERLIVAGNLVGGTASGITDSSCNLMPAYSSYVGSTGYQDGVATQYTVTPSAGANGSISPNTSQMIASGATTQFTVTPNSGYTASVGGTCGGSLVGTTYTTNAITANCTVSATFVAIDTTPPTISNPLPSGELPYGTTATTLQVGTSEAATCRYDTSNVAYASMGNTFASTGGVTHQQSGFAVSNGQSYTRYVRCIDGSGNANTSSTAIAFSVASSASDTTPPALSGLSPSGDLSAPTTSVSLAVTTDEAATCRFGQRGAQYSGMVVLGTTGATSHGHTLATRHGGIYETCFRCQDGSANVSAESCTRFAVPDAPKARGSR